MRFAVLALLGLASVDAIRMTQRQPGTAAAAGIALAPVTSSLLQVICYHVGAH